MKIGDERRQRTSTKNIDKEHRALRIAQLAPVTRHAHDPFYQHAKFATQGEINSLIAGDFKFAGAQMAASYNKVALI
jgi:hypothetical protein